MTAAVDPDRQQWDVIVVGGGAAGENAAQYATQFSGLRAVIVENGLLGGECSYWACMPSKALLRPVEVLSTGRDLPGVKELLGERPLDVQAVLARRDAVVNHLDDSSQVDWALGAGIDVVRGSGRLSGVREVTVTGSDGAKRVLRARHAVVLDTGSASAVPPVPGLAEARPWTSRDVTNMHEVPRRMVVVGGGVVACESVTWLHALGVEEITVIESTPGLLAKNEPFAGQIIEDQFRAAGITVRTATKVVSARRAEVNDAPVGHRHGGEVSVSLESGEQITADEVLVAAGRRPNSEDIGLELVGLTSGGFVAVDDQLCVEGVDG
ncbi:MAG: hypothetical protein QOI26_585, partial [Pseudonocardiales bacterium]|nr:hypothetical protein [Pseudonocardiales bacterium]